MTNNTVPRINTLRSDGEVPRTSDCFTPRSMEGTDGAFKNAEYGNTISGPYMAPGRWLTPILWAAAATLIAAVIVMVLLKA